MLRTRHPIRVYCTCAHASSSCHLRGVNPYVILLLHAYNITYITTHHRAYSVAVRHCNTYTISVTHAYILYQFQLISVARQKTTPPHIHPSRKTRDRRVFLTSSHCHASCKTFWNKRRSPHARILRQMTHELRIVFICQSLGDTIPLPRYMYIL